MQFTHPTLIKIDPKFENVYNKDPTVLENMILSMREKGFDSSTPIIVWKEKGILIDGHTRVRAAIAARLACIPYVECSFKDDKEVFAYMGRVQFDRRNSTDADKIRLLLKDPDFATAVNRQQYIAEKFRCSLRTAAKFSAIMNNPAKLKAALSADSEGTPAEKPVKESTELYLTHAKRLLKNLPEAPVSEEGRKVLRELRLKVDRVLRGRG